MKYNKGTVSRVVNAHGVRAYVLSLLFRPEIFLTQSFKCKLGGRDSVHPTHLSVFICIYGTQSFSQLFRQSAGYDFINGYGGFDPFVFNIYTDVFSSPNGFGDRLFLLDAFFYRLNPFVGFGNIYLTNLTIYRGGIEKFWLIYLYSN